MLDDGIVRVLVVESIALVSQDGREHIAEAIAKKKGAILLSAHVGNARRQDRG